MQDHLIGEKGNFHLWMFSRDSSEIYYRLHIDNVPLDEPRDDDFVETENCYYAQIENLVAPPIIRYFSNAPGGAIWFRGKGYWSGNADDLGKDIGFELSDVVINNRSGYAMESSEVYNVVRLMFPFIKSFQMKEGTIVVPVR